MESVTEPSDSVHIDNFVVVLAPGDLACACGAGEKSYASSCAVSKQTANSENASDYGPGVSAETLPHIFDPLFQADSSRDPATGNVGLGLAITRRAVLIHHGNITAENAHPGLLVTIDLPRAVFRQVACESISS